MLYLTCTTITSVDLAHYGVSCAEDWVSVDCDTIKLKLTFFFLFFFLFFFVGGLIPEDFFHKYGTC